MFNVIELTFIKILIVNKIIGFNFANMSEVSMGYTYTAWGEWTSSCDRNCSDPFGMQVRHRECLYCSGRDCKLIDSVECKSIINYANIIESRPCYNGTIFKKVWKINSCALNDAFIFFWIKISIASFCTGAGFYTGEYGEWVAGDCILQTCEVKGIRTVTRDCKKTHKSGIYFECSDLAEIGSKKIEPCQKSSNAAGIESNYYLWTQWSEWTCDTNKCTNDQVMGAVSRVV